MFLKDWGGGLRWGLHETFSVSIEQCRWVCILITEYQPNKGINKRWKDAARIQQQRPESRHGYSHLAYE